MGLRRLLIKSFSVGLLISAFCFFFFQDYRIGFDRLYLEITIQNIVSGIMSGVGVGFLITRSPFQGIGTFSAVTAIAGSTCYFVVKGLLQPSFTPYLLYYLLANSVGTAIGGFIGGVLGGLITQILAKKSGNSS